MGKFRILIILAVLIGAPLLCIASVRGLVRDTGQQTNQTLALMANIKLADTMKTQAITIDHMAWGYIVAIVAMAIVAVIISLSLSRVIKSFSDGGGITGFLHGAGEGRQELHGMPKMLLLNRDPRQYFRHLPPETQNWLYKKLNGFISILGEEMGLYSLPMNRDESAISLRLPGEPIRHLVAKRQPDTRVVDYKW